MLNLIKKAKTRDELIALLRYARPLSWYVPGRTIHVHDKMQKNYSYTLTERPGKNLKFKPELSPARMLKLGVFEGKYLNDCIMEFPREWYVNAKISPGHPDINCNAFKIKSRLSLATWRKNNWIPAAPGDRDIRGWFQWYCRYWLGRRQPEVDAVQISRWKSFVRHRGQILASYKKMHKIPRTISEKKKHRPRQRQALLQWAYNSVKL